MNDLVVIGFDDEHTAFEMRAELAKLQKGRVLKTSLTKDKEEELQEVLSEMSD